MPYIPDPMLLVIYALALASVTALVVGADTLTERAHEWIVDRIVAPVDWSVGYFDSTPGSAGWFVIKLIMGACWLLAKMISCSWCASFWLACLMLWGVDHWRDPVVLFLALAMAFRQFVGMTSSMGR
jgi:hypothetical protein